MGTRACVLACVALLGACDHGPAVRRLPPTPPVAVAVTPAPPSFRRDVLPELTERCASVDGCHGDAPTDSVALDLRPQAAWAELVDHPAKARPGALRVAPGDPAASFLLDKLSGTLGPREGKAMPLDPDTGVALEPSPLSAGYVESTLRPWIAAGAPDN